MRANQHGPLASRRRGYSEECKVLFTYLEDISDAVRARFHVLLSPTKSPSQSAMSDYGIHNPEAANLTQLSQQQVVCYLNAGGNEYNGDMGARISSIFVIGAVSTILTFFPVLARRVPRLKIPLYVYLFARYFGSGVIIATAFVHLLDPAYSEIGPASCVGLTGGWSTYSWPPAIALSSAMFIFLLDLVAERYVEIKYGVNPEQNVEDIVTGQAANENALQSQRAFEKMFQEDFIDGDDLDGHARNLAVRQQMAAFLILEFGVLFHSVIIGLNLGVSGDEFSTLYVVLVFHQSFEGLGIGARLSAIPFKQGSWIPWLLCAAYGVTTPLAIAIGLGVHTTYDPNSFTANVVSGVLDSISAGILLYTGFVELLARDFIFNPDRTRSNRRLTYMTVCVFLGAGIMALLGKWA